MNALVTDSRPGWTDSVETLLPGAHVAVFAESEADVVGVQGRFAGLELRDALVVLRAGPRISLVLLFRKPVVESVTAQVMATGTGGINLGACRPETDEVITTHSRGITTASPATREKSIEGDETIFVIHFYDASGLHSSVAAAESKVRAKAAKHSAEVPSLLYASLPSIKGRARQDVFEPNERSSRWPTNVLLVHDQYEWYAMSDDTPRAIIDAVYTHFGADEKLRTVRGRVQGDAQQDQETPFLLPGVRWAEHEIDPPTREEEGVGQGEEAGSTSFDERTGAPPERDQGRQPPGQPVARGLDGTQPEAPRGRGGASSNARGEPRFEVASWALPERFRPYFIQVGVGGCHQGGCVPGCPVLALADAARFFPTFKNQGEVRAWVETLVTPTGVHEST